MSKILSVIPNVCEGQDKAFIDQLTQKLKSIPEVVVLDVSMDATRNRTVFALTGTREGIFDGGMVLYEEALKHIDMRRHKGEYPRIGAVDVFPFVPLRDFTIEEAVDTANEFARQVAEKFNLPVYLYGECARYPLRKDVERIRDVQYEGLADRLKDPRWKPDFGPDEFKPDSGATIIGARYPMVSFKIYLDTKDIEVTRKICQSIQYDTGGLRHVTANSGVVHGTNRTHVTVSIHNYKITPMYKVIEMTRMESRHYNVNVENVEMIGLVPENVFIDSAMYYLNIRDFSFERILEKNIQTHLNQKL
jgi:glutamate formiminotransferase / 5-formyltetrahydrofolate cyclo-ligase